MVDCAHTSAEQQFLEHAELELGHLEHLLHALTKLSAHCCGDERLMNAAMADAICHAATQSVERLANRLHDLLNEDPRGASGEE